MLIILWTPKCHTCIVDSYPIYVQGIYCKLRILLSRVLTWLTHKEPMWNASVVHEQKSQAQDEPTLLQVLPRVEWHTVSEVTQSHWMCSYRCEACVKLDLKADCIYNVLTDVEAQLALPFMTSDKLVFICAASVFLSMQCAVLFFLSCNTEMFSQSHVVAVLMQTPCWRIFC